MADGDALALRGNGGGHDLAAVAGQLPALFQLAGALLQAQGFIPSHLRTEGHVVAVILAGAELGLPTMAAIRGLHLVNGKVGAGYDTMVGLLRRAGYRVEWLEKSATVAHLRLTHPDGTTHEERWDVERAKQAKLWGRRGPWSDYPEAMLSARCVSSAGRAFAGDVMAGVYSTEEAREIAGNGHHAPPQEKPDGFLQAEARAEYGEAYQESEAAFEARKVASREWYAKEVRPTLATLKQEIAEELKSGPMSEQLKQDFCDHLERFVRSIAHDCADMVPGAQSNVMQRVCTLLRMLERPQTLARQWLTEGPVEEDAEEPIEAELVEEPEDIEEALRRAEGGE